MNEYTLLFCILPPAAALGLIISQMQTIAAKHNREQAKEDRAAEALAIRQAKAARDAQLHEAKLAKEHNLVVLQDAKLDLELLKIQAAKRKLGINDAPFTANDYPDPHASSGPPPARN